MVVGYENKVPMRGKDYSMRSSALHTNNDRVGDDIYKIQDTRCIFRASVATLSGLSTEKSHEQVLLKSIKVCKYK